MTTDVSAVMPACIVEKKRASCACGGRNAVRIVLEYVDYNDQSTQYLGGRFCYVDRAVIGMKIPADAILVQMSIYDIHEPDEIIRIDFHPKTPNESRDSAVSPERPVMIP
jgi:ribosomal protein L35AE/L33A